VGKLRVSLLWEIRTRQKRGLDVSNAHRRFEPKKKKRWNLPQNGDITYIINNKWMVFSPPNRPSTSKASRKIATGGWQDGRFEMCPGRIRKHQNQGRKGRPYHRKIKKHGEIDIPYLLFGRKTKHFETGDVYGER